MTNVNNTARDGELARRVSEELLPYVEQPGQYIGGEVNQIKKELGSCEGDKDCLNPILSNSKIIHHEGHEGHEVKNKKSKMACRLVNRAVFPVR